MRKFEKFVCIDWSGQAVARPTLTIALENGSTFSFANAPYIYIG